MKYLPPGRQPSNNELIYQSDANEVMKIILVIKIEKSNNLPRRERTAIAEYFRHGTKRNI